MSHIPKFKAENTKTIAIVSVIELLGKDLSAGNNYTNYFETAGNWEL